MKLITSIIWMGSGIVWTINVAGDLTNVWYWLALIVSFAACIFYAMQFDKQLRKQ